MALNKTRQTVLSTPKPDHLELPTLAVAALIYGGFGALTWWHASVPWWLVLPIGGYLLAWHGSLQHEVVHGHPTPWAALNEALVFPSLWLWGPFRVYRENHLAHHKTPQLTNPLEDPESYYLVPSEWQRLPAWRKALLTAHNTLLGRLVLGPPLLLMRFFADEIEALSKGKPQRRSSWLLHLAGCLPVLLWVLVVCDIPLFEYLLLYVYPGISLTLLRSFAEHRASERLEHRTAIVESGPVLSLMFLNNNLHVVHHDEPGLSWYRIPGRWRQNAGAILAKNGGYHFRGYRHLGARYLLRPKEPVALPG